MAATKGTKRKRTSTKSVRTTGQRPAGRKKTTKTSTKKRPRATKSRVTKGSKIRTTPTIRKHLAGYMDPFSVTGGAKIPDGAAMQSLPLQHRVVREIISTGVQGAANPSTEGDINIIMYPGLQSGLAWSVVPPSGSNEELNWFSFATDSWVGGFIGGEGGPDNVVGPGRFSLPGGVSRWRTVSQALRLSLVNTDHENDGWWESSRITYKPDMGHWAIVSPAGNHSVTGTTQAQLNLNGNGAFFGADDNLVDYLEGKNLAEHLSYKCGALKDIHKCQWNLMPFSKDNDMVELNEYYNTATPAMNVLPQPPSGGVQVTLGLQQGNSDVKDIYNGLMDTNHDMVLIRVHTGTSGTKLLADMAVNQEVVYDVDSILAKHMTTTDVDKTAFEAAKNLKHASNQSSAMVVEA